MHLSARISSCAVQWPAILTLALSVVISPVLHAGQPIAPPRWSPPIPTGASQPTEPILVGSLSLQPCPGLPAYCGSLERPLDPAGHVPGHIAIHFEFHPRRDTTQPALGTLVAVEGGPGYPSTGSREGFRALFAPLLERRDLLLMDNRGTGQSGVIRCPAIQGSAYLFQAGIEQCGRHLGESAYLYGSGLAADDLAALLDALAVGQIDLYGDSYGTFFSQAFAGRHPERLRSLVLDAAYPVIGGSAWYPEAAPAMGEALASVCRQSPRCNSLPGNALDRLDTLTRSLRSQPFSGTAPDGEGNPVTAIADPAHLAALVFSNATGPVLYRELDAAARAYLEGGQTLPLLRLLAESGSASVSSGPGTPPTYYSAGQFAAVSCTDYPFLYDLAAPPAQRQAQRNAAFALQRSQDPDLYAPFRIGEFNAMPLDYSVIDTCLTWPVATPEHPQGQPVPPGALFTSAPVLVLSGNLDSLTPPEQGAQAAALFPNARHIRVANSYHVTALYEQDDCASRLVRRFVADLDPGDTRCAAHIAEVRTLPGFALSAAELAPATPLAGNQGSEEDLRVAAAAAYTAGDALARWWVNYDGSGVGLRGGEFESTYQDGLYQFRLRDMRWVEDVTVSGSLSWDYVTPGQVRAALEVQGDGLESGQLEITWNDREPLAQARITGRIGGRTIEATLYAP